MNTNDQLLVDRELLEELLESAEDGTQHKGKYLSEKYREPELFEKVRALLAAQPAEVEPVAWLVESAGAKSFQGRRPRWAEGDPDYKVTPLYAHPPRDVAAELSDGELLALADKAFGKVVDHDLRGNPITDYSVLLMGAYGPAVKRLISLARQHPVSYVAAGGVVLPERRPDDYPSSRTRDCWNACLDEITRLNGPKA